MGLKSSVTRALAIYFLVFLVLLVVFFPIFVLIVQSFMPTAFTWDFTLLTLKHYTIIFSPRSTYGLGPPLINSTIVISLSTALSLVFSCFSAFALTKFRLKGRRGVAFFLMALNMVPTMIFMVPLFYISREIGVYDTREFLILIYMSFNIPFSTWLLRGFFASVPSAIEESALVDGCSKLGSFFKVTLPLSKTGIAVTTIFTFIFTWNEFTMAMMLTDRYATLPVVVGRAVGRASVEWGPMAAFGLISVIPVIILAFIAQKYIVAGLTMGAVKG